MKTKRVIQCVYTQMDGDSFEFGFTILKDVGTERERLIKSAGINSKPYSFFTDIEDLSVNDLVVVQTAGKSNRFGMAICQVSAIEGLTKYQRDLASEWVIQKIDLKTHQERLARAAVEQEIRNKLRERKEEMDELMIYKTLAKDDPEVEALLKRLVTFDPSVKMLLPERSGEPKEKE